MEQESKRQLFSNSYFALIAGALVLTLALIAGFTLKKALKRNDQIAFRNKSNHIEHLIRDRLDTYIYILNQSRNLLQVKPDISREEFRSYVENLDLNRKYPGVQGVGFSPRIKKVDLDAFEKKTRRTGIKDFHVWPKHPRDDHYTIIYLEPMDWRNKRALGYDMSTESARQKAMDTARDTGLAAMSEAVELVQETKRDKQDGFLIYSPLYKNLSLRPSLEERRKKISGFIFAPFRGRDLFNEVLKNTIDDQIYVKVSFLKGSSIFETSVLPEEDEEGFKAIKIINVGQRDLSIEIRSLADFHKNINHSMPWVVISLGALIAGLVTFLLHKNAKHSRLMEDLYHKAQSAIATRDEFLSIASHELKTPITTMRLQFQLAQRLIDKGDRSFHNDQAVTKRIKTSLRQLDRMNQLIEDMLETSRIALGKLQFTLVEFDIVTVLRDILDRFSDQIKGLGVELNVEIPDEEIITFGDEFRIEQVISNLITNALKYGDGKPINLKLSQTSDTITLTIEDQGIGIAEEKIPYVFDRFERAVTHGYSGLGLGLYICKKIVDAHNGSIDVSSTLGVGSIFTVNLPTKTSLQEKSS